MVIRLQWSKYDSGYSLHVNPSSYSTAGLQKTDLLAYLGFERNDTCPFTSSRRCYVKWIPEKFDSEGFLRAFEDAFAHLGKAERGLNECGFLLPQPEGWGFYHERPGGRSHSGPTTISGDGHTTLKTNSMKQTEDDTFLFRFSFVETDYEKGFVTHYRPKHPPLSSELRIVLKYLGLQEFQECPEFDFEPCFYRTRSYESQGYGFFDDNTHAAHGAFDAHANRFSAAIQELLSANKKIEACGLTLLPGPSPVDRLTADLKHKIILPDKPADEAQTTYDPPSDFDVAISVSGPDKQYARELAEHVRAEGFSVFYYEFYPEFLWGKDLTITFDEIFRKRSRFCVMFVSRNYRDRVWTTHEMRSALARAIEQKGNEYILPVRIDNTELEGLLPTISYLTIDLGIPKIAELLMKKLRS